MTSFVAWIGVDSRAPASIYLASDSRISWTKNDPLNCHWDYGRKLFASTKYPEILGYYGSVVFPSHVLAQIMDLIDSDLLFQESYEPQKKLQLILSIVRRSFKHYPLQNDEPFTIVYCTRESDNMFSVFHTARIDWSKQKGWKHSWLETPSRSDVILTGGSGTQSINHWYERWKKTSEKGTSRSVFSAFCDSLNSGEDKYSGGAPQIVGIYRTGPAKTFGVIYESKRYIFGINVDKSDSLAQIEWRNSLFERCDWKTKKRFSGAQNHKRPEIL